MFNRTILSSFLIIGIAMNACLQTQSDVPSEPDPKASFFINDQQDTIAYVRKSDEEWKAILDDHAYYVLRNQGTERAFTGKYDKHKDKGLYLCAACQLPLFSSEAKFDSGTGWPSFFQPLDSKHVMEVSDNAFGMRRVEVVCRRCGGHLGHVFDDGPKPTGLRYCMNSVSLQFKPE